MSLYFDLSKEDLAAGDGCTESEFQALKESDLADQLLAEPILDLPVSSKLPSDMPHEIEKSETETGQKPREETQQTLISTQEQHAAASIWSLTLRYLHGLNREKTDMSLIDVFSDLSYNTETQPGSMLPRLLLMHGLSASSLPCVESLYEASRKETKTQKRTLVRNEDGTPHKKRYIPHARLESWIAEMTDLKQVSVETKKQRGPKATEEFTCKMCQEKFGFKLCFIRHLKSVHNVERSVSLLYKRFKTATKNCVQKS